MADFLQTLIATIAVGSLYALLALGYTMVYGVLKFINFAHSDVFVLGAWTAFTAATFLLTRLGIPAEQSPWWLVIVVLTTTVLVCSTVAFCIERFAYRPLRKAPRLNVLITAIGVSLLLQNVGQLPSQKITDGLNLPFGATPKSMPQLIEDTVLNDTTVATGTLSGGSKRGVVKLDQPIDILPDRSYLLEFTRPSANDGASNAAREESLGIAMPAGHYEAGTELATQPKRNAADVEGAKFTLLRSPLVPIRLIDVLIVGSSITLMIGLQLLVFRTKMGMAMRALSYNVDNASLMGINANFVISFTFVLGAALAACAAFLYPLKYPGLNQTAHGIWVLLGLKAFVAAVVGGIGNIRGAVLGGFLIAGIEFFGTLYGSKLTDALGLGPSLGTGLRDVYVFVLLIVVLLVRPSGLLGTPVREKV